MLNFKIKCSSSILVTASFFRPHPHTLLTKGCIGYEVVLIQPDCL